MKLSDYIRLLLTAGIAFGVLMESGKWTALAIWLLLIGAELQAYVSRALTKNVDSLISLVETLNEQKDLD